MATFTGGRGGFVFGLWICACPGDQGVNIMDILRSWHGHILSRSTPAQPLREGLQKNPLTPAGQRHADQNRCYPDNMEKMQGFTEEHQR